MSVNFALILQDEADCFYKKSQYMYCETAIESIETEYKFTIKQPLSLFHNTNIHICRFNSRADQTTL